MRLDWQFSAKPILYFVKIIKQKRPQEENIDRCLRKNRDCGVPAISKEIHIFFRDLNFFAGRIESSRGSHLARGPPIENPWVRVSHWSSEGYRLIVHICYHCSTISVHVTQLLEHLTGHQKVTGCGHACINLAQLKKVVSK